MKSCPGFGFLKGRCRIQYQLSDFDYYKVVIKKLLLVLFYAAFRYLAAAQCISVFKYMYICLSFFYYLYFSQLYSYIFYSQFLAIRLFKIRYSTVSLIKELHLHSFKLYQQVLYFNKQRFCGKNLHQVRYVVIF